MLALLALVIAPAPAALASLEGAGNSFQHLTEGSSEESNTTSTASTTSSTSSSSGEESHGTGTVEAVVLAVGGALLAGVAFVIIRDARRWAPVGDAELVEGSTSRHSRAALQRRRAKAKAARRQRKRNR